MTQAAVEVRPFAIMRLTHDAIRQGMRDLQAAPPGPEAQAVLSELWRCIRLHARQEDERFFRVLNEMFDGIVDKEGIPREHAVDVQEVSEVERRLAELAAGHATAADVQATVDHWAAAVEAHLQHEEDVMMPLTEKVAPTVEGRAAVVHTILAVDPAEFQAHQLGYVTRQLSRAEQPGKLRMYVAALRAVATADEYTQYAALIAKSVTPAGRAALEQAALL